MQKNLLEKLRTKFLNEKQIEVLKNLLLLLLLKLLLEEKEKDRERKN